MASEAEVEAAARAIYEADPVPMKMFDRGEIKDLARAALEAAERAREMERRG